MLEISRETIRESCFLANNHFPPFFVLNVLKEITNEYLDSFPLIKDQEEEILKIPNYELSKESIEEMSDFFYENQNFEEDRLYFLIFLKNLSSNCLENKVLNKYKLDEFISQINPLLLTDSEIKIENYKIIQKWIPYNKTNNLNNTPDIYLNINVPHYIIDYLSEALSAISYDLHRSAILFSSFAFEASLRYKYFETYGHTLIKKGKSEITFYKLIQWALKNNLIEVQYAEEENLTFIRKYRNDLAHYDFTKTENQPKITEEYARKMSVIIMHLVTRFINEVFYE